MNEQLDAVANEVLAELNSGERQPELDYIWNYGALADEFKAWLSDQDEDIKEAVAGLMGDVWPQAKIDAVANGTWNFSKDDLDQFADRRGIDLDTYSFIEIKKYDISLGWAIFIYYHFNECPYKLLKTFVHKSEMDTYIKNELERLPI